MFVLVGVASLFAIINFADLPAEEINNFLLSTALFFAAIVILALMAVAGFKLLASAGRLLFSSAEEADDIIEVAETKTQGDDRE